MSADPKSAETQASGEGPAPVDALAHDGGAPDINTAAGIAAVPTALEEVKPATEKANNGDEALAEKQLTDALRWRKEVNPSKLLDDKAYDRARFGDLGFVTVHRAEDAEERVITWNIYGSVKDNKATFGNVKEFVEWRAALMEFGVRKLKLNDAKTPIPEGAEDPYQMIQVHDYMGVSFFRMDPHVKASSKETIQTLSMAYPELLSHKYFVNVPAIMGWVFGAMKLFLSPATLRKFHPMSSGASLANEIKPFAATLPKEYGGSGPSVKEGLTVKLRDPAPPTEETPEAVSEIPAAASAEPEAAQVNQALEEDSKADVQVAEAQKVENVTQEAVGPEIAEELGKTAQGEAQLNTK
ncbi:unnamed protein product [Parascedosporium putredinis]|uniref:Phosphatidylinositol transfer protein SFH5 n=1 Tax=Parascedosporium putredinis TaxID=1442378 RepID=A0A9P1HAP1_9PEZI|nr:unnamed protein product [Parascedosporium putredinis]CAI8001485.1 unnamed protein product [Parascedosporium putredinis]